jgi:hypothetical protein
VAKEHREHGKGTQPIKLHNAHHTYLVFSVHYHHRLTFWSYIARVGRHPKFASGFSQKETLFSEIDFGLMWLESSEDMKQHEAIPEGETIRSTNTKRLQLP